MSYAYNNRRKKLSNGHTRIADIQVGSFGGPFSGKMPHVSCGMPSSQRCHSPSKVRFYRAYKKARTAKLKQLLEERENLRIEQRDKREQHEAATQLVTGKPEQSRIRQFWNKTKKILNTKVF